MKAVFLAQIFISFTMALLMIAYATLLERGLAPDFVSTWLLRFIVAWPVALVLSIPVGKLGFMLAGRIVSAGRR